MNDLIRTDTIFGKRANIVGNISADLVLESLGKVYIKSRNSAKTLEEVILSLVTDDAGSTASRTLIVEGIENLTNVKEGLLIYDKLSNILYIWLDDNPLELINVSSEETGYVKRTGDTMTGRLTINVPNGAPLYVNSNTLVENLNANYLEGNPASTFTRRTVDENITGKWTFRSPTKFESNTWFGQDIIAGGSIGTRNFVGGFGGYGWRLDAETNTLTIDNLIVRKLMQVYELVINRISATNGSLWVTNAGKVIKAYKLPVFSTNEITSLTVDLNSKIVSLLDLTSDNAYFIIFPSSVSQGDVYTTFSGNHLLNASGSNRNTATLTTYSTVARSQAYIVNIKDRSQLGSIVSLIQEIDGENINIYVYNLTTTFSAHNIPTAKENNPAYKIYKLYSDNFKFDTRLPIIARDYYHAYLASEYQRKEYDKAIINLNNVNISTYVSRAEASYPDALKGLKDGNNNPRFLTSNDVIAYTYSYYKYYASGDFYIVTFDDDQLPVFKPGDLLRCLKWTYGGIKYYDAIVCNYINESTYIIQLADSVFDKQTKVSYDNNLQPTVVEGEEIENETLYNLSGRTSFDLGKTDSNGNAITDSIIGVVEEKDSLVLMGNLWDTQRLNAVYITSTDDGAPYMDVLSGLNRPDFSVIYYTPLYETVKLYAKNAVPGVTNVAIPYTGDYYVQNNINLSEYILGTVIINGVTETILVPSSTNGWQQWLTSKAYLSTTPNANTKLLKADIYGDITGQNDDFSFVTEEVDENQNPLYNITQEQVTYGITANSTRTTKVRIGNLDGIQDDLFPIDKQPYGYGLYGSNVFLVGEFYLSNGRSLAEISNEAITFATAARDASLNGLDLLRRDTNIIKERLQKELERLDDNTYKIDQLKTAGMMLSGNVMFLWGGSILLYTLYSELDGEPVYSRPTALFENGCINAKFLKIDRALSTFDYLVTTDEIFTCGGVTYKALSNPGTLGSDTDKYNVRVYVRLKVIKNVENEYIKTIDLEHPETIYCRKFTPNDNSGDIWLLVTPDGKPIYRINTTTLELEVVPMFYYYYLDGQTSSDPIKTYTEGKFEEYDTYFLQDTEPLKRWALQIDGKGNLGGNSLYWNSIGKVVVNGTLYSTEGNIGGFYIRDNGFFTYDNTGLFNPVKLSSIGYGWGDTNTLEIPMLEFNTGKDGIVSHRTNLNAKGLFYLINTLNSGTSNNWYDFLSLQVPSLIFALTLIPIYYEDDHLGFYARLSSGYGGFLYLNICYDGNGNYILNFDLLNIRNTNWADEWKNVNDWFTKLLILGSIHFSATGYNSGRTSFNLNNNYPVTNTNKMSSGESSVMGRFIFNPSYMIDNKNAIFRMSTGDYRQTLAIKPSVNLISFRSSKYSFNPYLTDPEKVDTKRLYRYGIKIHGNVDNSYKNYYDEGGVYSYGLAEDMFTNSWSNAIHISTADDDTLNLGGFTLIGFYVPSFDTRYIENTSSINPNDELRAELINDYGTNGNKYNDLLFALNNKKNSMTSAQLTDQASDISDIRTSITNMGSTADNISTDATYSDLQTIQAGLENTYNNILTNINNLLTEDTIILTWSSSSFTYNGDNLNNAPTLTVDPIETVVTYSSSNTEVATINDEGVISIINGITSGSTTITATVERKTASYTLTVSIQDINSELNDIIDMVIVGSNYSPLGVEISRSNTPITYSYLELGYQYLLSLGDDYDNNQSKTWLIANMMSELTPVTLYASAYFYNSVWNDGSSGANTVSSSVNSEVETAVQEYENRCKGAFAYVQFKNSDLSGTFEAADSARAELRLKGISVANMQSGSFDEDINDSLVVHALDITTSSSVVNQVVNNNKRIIPLSAPLVSQNSYDYNYTLNLVSDLGSISAIADYNLQIGEYLPLLDKYYKYGYFQSILGLSSDADVLISKILNYTGKESGRLKCTYWRKRPNIIMASTFASTTPCSYNTLLSDGMYGIYLADESKVPSIIPLDKRKTLNSELVGFALGDPNASIGNPNTCGSYDPYTSFPSGHSVVAYLTMLATVEAYGDSMNVGSYTSRGKRIDDYCENRAVVRAHWKTDTIIGKITSSILIGFLNGYTSFRSLVSGNNSLPTDCTNCEAATRFTGGNTYSYGWAPLTGFNEPGRTYVIGFYKFGDCSTNITPEFDALVVYSGYATLSEFKQLWLNVTINVTSTPLLTEDGSSTMALPEGFTHYITASSIPANTTGKVITVRFYCTNPLCINSKGKTDYFGFNQYAS